MNYSGFENLKGILEKVSHNLNLDRGLKEISLLKTWPEIIGSRFESKTKAVSVLDKKRYDVLLIATKNPAISQDLMFFKNDILKKLYKPSVSLGFNVKDIIFNHKIWNETVKPYEESSEVGTIKIYSEKPTEEELSQIEIPESITSSIKESLNNQEFSDNEIKSRMLKTIINDVKLQIWRKNRGFPSCKGCGITLTYANQEMLCPSCLYSN